MVWQDLSVNVWGLGLFFDGRLYYYFNFIVCHRSVQVDHILLAQIQLEIYPFLVVFSVYLNIGFQISPP
jgi:hypothetical protein